MRRFFTQGLPCVFCCLFTLFAWGYEDLGGELYIEDQEDLSRFSGCGQFCQVSPDYFQSYLTNREQSFRIYAPFQAGTLYEGKDSEEISSQDYYPSFDWKPVRQLRRALVRRQLRWSRAALNVGISVQEEDRSVGSAIWREVRKPILYEIRDYLRRPFRKSKPSFEERVTSWALEQSLDVGASTVGLESHEGATNLSTYDFGIKGYRLRFYPRLDPYKGRYGVRLKFRKYAKKNRPIRTRLAFNYCNSEWGIGDRTCRYLHEITASLVLINPTARISCRTYISYQTASLDPDAYVFEGEEFDFKPWLGGISLTYRLD